MPSVLVTVSVTIEDEVAVVVAVVTGVVYPRYSEQKEYNVSESIIEVAEATRS